MSITFFIFLVKFSSSAWWPFQSTICLPEFLLFSSRLDTGSSILDMYLILFLNCIHIWNHSIITKSIDYIFLWFFWTWYLSEVNVLTNLIIQLHQKPVVSSHSIWRRSNLLLNNYLLILGFFPWPQNTYNWPYCCFCSQQSLIGIIIVF